MRFNFKKTINNNIYKSNNKKYKNIFNEWDLFIEWSLNLGNSHFAITINFPDYGDDIKNLNRDKSEDNLLYNELIDEYLYYFLDFPKLTTWLFITNEENKNGILHLHCLLAVRNLIDYNNNIKNNILNIIKTSLHTKYQHLGIYNTVDIVIKNLNGFINIKNWIIYLHINKVWIFQPRIYILDKFYKVLEDRFINCYFYDPDCNLLHLSERDVVRFYFISNRKFFASVDAENIHIDENSNIVGCKIVNNKLSQEIFIDLILYYLNLNKLFIYNNNIYEKVNFCKISYKFIGSIKEILYDNFEENIIKFFIKNYPCHFINFDFYYLIKFFKHKVEFIIEKIKDLTKNKIKPDFSLMEFNDGIFSLKENKFYKDNTFLKHNSYIVNNTSTIKYYNKSYSWIRHNPPLNWIKGIKNALDINPDENINIFVDSISSNKKVNEFIIICLFIANLFQENSINKKKFLYLYGQSNTGKTTYINKVLSSFFSEDNIGSIVGNENFVFQDIIDKKLVIIDEFKYNTKLKSDFLKLLGGERLLIQKKYSKNHILIKNSKGVILSNSLFKEQDENINKALYNRLHVIEFINNIINSNNNIFDIDNKLFNEEANIIIYCNKIYFHFFKKFLKNNLIKYNNNQYIDFLEFFEKDIKIIK